MAKQPTNNHYVTDIDSKNTTDTFVLPTGNRFQKVKTFMMPFRSKTFLKNLPRLGLCHVSTTHYRPASFKKTYPPQPLDLDIYDFVEDSIYIAFEDSFITLPFSSLDEHSKDLCQGTETLKPDVTTFCESVLLDEFRPHVLCGRESGRVDLIQTASLNIIQSFNTEYQSNPLPVSSISLNEMTDKPLFLVGYANGVILSYTPNLAEVNWPESDESRLFSASTGWSGPIQHDKQAKSITSLISSINRILRNHRNATLITTVPTTTSPLLFRDVTQTMLSEDIETIHVNTPLFSSANYFPVGQIPSYKPEMAPHVWGVDSPLPPLSSLSLSPPPGSPFFGFKYLTRSQPFNPLRKWIISNGPVHCIKSSPKLTSGLVAFGTDEGYVVVFNIIKEIFHVALQTYSGACLSCAWSSDGEMLAFGGEDDLITVYTHIETRPRPLCRLEGHSNFIRQIVFDPGYPVTTSGTRVKPPAVASISAVLPSCIYQVMTGSDDGKAFPWAFNPKNVESELVALVESFFEAEKNGILNGIDLERIQVHQKDKDRLLPEGKWTDTMERMLLQERKRFEEKTKEQEKSKSKGTGMMIGGDGKKHRIRIMIQALSEQDKVYLAQSKSSSLALTPQITSSLTPAPEYTQAEIDLRTLKRFAERVCPPISGVPALDEIPTAKNTFLVFPPIDLNDLPPLSPGQSIAQIGFGMISDIVWTKGVLCLGSSNGNFVFWKESKSRKSK
ncbi:hypothetical protein BLNAU_7383 [Blattamonas nauphoetae]|uniref:Uncharacterized protein n=1 Tax=Blattamonas nauphoetae TaxID=2049346 RepID=A0ABQ9Y209_9EUKA|nr:hypothetical protein BLNAU_7383 [Blattamonas nauphoetae]